MPRLFMSSHRSCLWPLAFALSAAMLGGCASRGGKTAASPTGATPASALSDSSSTLTADARAALTHIRMTGDNLGLPFMVIDKRQAHVWVFDARGRTLGESPVLLGKARGDHTASGIGDKPLAQIKDHERTTPAGRFVVEPGRNAHGDNVLWIDYDAAVSMHVVRSVDKSERRAERLASPTPEDNRISYGCINVMAPFFDKVLDPVFGRAARHGIAYVLPESKPAYTLFEPPVVGSR